jgi:hypothetical protein
MPTFPKLKITKHTRKLSGLGAHDFSKSHGFGALIAEGYDSITYVR